MLKELRIHNIALIEQAILSFGPNLTILTGETGSGKSAILYSLSLAMGERASNDMIRQGCEKGVVEALFEIDHSPIPKLLAEAGIDHEEGQELIIRRELYSSGKGRLFINHQPAQLSFLRQLTLILMHRVGQHMGRSLFSLDYHRHSLDLYGNLHPLLQTYQESDRREKNLRVELEQLIQEEAKRLREIETYRHEIEELEMAQLKEGEEEELFSEYTILTHAEELSTKIHAIHHALSGDRNPLLPLLNRHKQLLESLVNVDPALHDPLKSFQNAFLELQEVAHTLQIYQGRLRFDPERLGELNDRLALLNRLKRKYGATATEMLSYLCRIKEQVHQLQQADAEIEVLQEQLKEVSNHTEQLSHKLTEARQRTAARLEEALTLELRTLNMSKAEFIVQVSAQNRMQEGADRVEFLLRPNLGEREVSLREGASGGEISRVLLALHTLLAEKEKKSTLIFDEIDANIGGETATIVGDKLRSISRQHQVICITHFPQVAIQAHHHLKISKEEKEGRTLTYIQELDALSRPQELARMTGIRKELA